MQIGSQVILLFLMFASKNSKRPVYNLEPRRISNRKDTSNIVIPCIGTFYYYFTFTVILSSVSDLEN